MHERPADLTDADVRACLRAGWGIDAHVEYAAVGFGSHHWIAVGGDDRWFVTVDDLRRKPMLGRSTREVHARLASAYLAARLLHEGGLEFVVAPRAAVGDPSAGTETMTIVLDDRWAVSVLPYVEGTRWGFSDILLARQSDELVVLLARLHAAARPPVALRIDVPPSGRDALVALLDDVDGAWTGGPHSEPARRWLVGHADLVRSRLRQVDAIAAQVTPADLVVTHGEPHPGNLLDSDDGLRLVDWDTVALAPRERDLWLVGTDEATAAAYEQASGHRVDRALLAAYRLAWDLADVASFLDELHGAHEDTADTRAALRFLTGLDLHPVAP